MHFVALHRLVLTKASPQLQLGEVLSLLQGAQRAEPLKMSRTVKLDLLVRSGYE